MSDWLAAYGRDYETYAAAAKHAEEVIADTLQGQPIALHAVAGRAKTPASVREKQSTKRYDKPEIEMTDVLGVRVITLYGHGVEEVADRIRNKFAVDEANSIDKTSALLKDQFGYRGVHLVVALGKTGALPPVADILVEHKVEIQIRSVVEHAWAEIEHELRYKSGIAFSHELSRRFNSIAGALEIIDREFSAIEQALIREIFETVRILEKGHLSQSLDTSSLLALLILRRPQASRLGPLGLPLSLRGAAGLVRGLREVGYADVATVDQALQSAEMRSVLRLYADARAIEPETASGYVVIGALLGITPPYLDTRDLTDDPILREILVEMRRGGGQGSP